MDEQERVRVDEARLGDSGVERQVEAGVVTTWPSGATQRDAMSYATLRDVMHV